MITTYVAVIEFLASRDWRKGEEKCQLRPNKRREGCRKVPTTSEQARRFGEFLESWTLSKVLLDITTPPFSHGQLYVALSRVRDCNNIMMYLTEKQLIINDSHSTGFMPSVKNIVYQDVLVHNS
jgi:hypothetical protein